MLSLLMRQSWKFCHFVALNEELMMGTTTFFTCSCLSPAYGKCSGCCFLHSGGLRKRTAGLHPVLCLSYQLFWYSVSLLSFSGISYTSIHRCSLLIPFPLRHVFLIQDSKGQPYPMFALGYREQQKDVSVVALLKTWVSIYLHHAAHCALQTYPAKLSIIH